MTMTQNSSATRSPSAGSHPRPRLPPGPSGLPLLGNALQLGKNRLGFLHALGRDYGDLSHAQLGPWSVYMLNSPSLIEDVLLGRHRDCIKDKSTRDLSVLVGQGLLTSEGLTLLNADCRGETCLPISWHNSQGHSAAPWWLT
jgi:hypothetical protein